jgi:glc operon protein GlcG
MDGCQLPPVLIAQNKAFTTARERRPSGEVGSRTLESGHPMTNYGDIRYTAWSGGLPVTHDGAVIGAIAVSGLTGEEDVELARAGLAAFRG